MLQALTSSESQVMGLAIQQAKISGENMTILGWTASEIRFGCGFNEPGKMSLGGLQVQILHL